MIILTDRREQRPYLFTDYDVQVEPATLPVGDYSLPGFEARVAIERKSINDLIGCLTKGRGRFERELSRARSYELFAVVVEATFQDILSGNYRSAMLLQSAAQSLLSFQIRHGVPFFWAGDRSGGEYVTHGLLSKHIYEIGKRYKTAMHGQKKSHES